MPHRSLRDIVGDRNLVYGGPDMSVRQACEKMLDHHVTAILILADGKLKGIFTKRDLMQRVIVRGHDPETTPLSEVMTRNPVTIDAQRLGFEAVKLMCEEKTRHIIVSGLNNGGYGVVCLHDIKGRELAAFENEMAFEKKVWEEI